MYIFTVPNRKSPPAILLCESDRQNGKVKTRTIANLTHWAPQRLEALRKAFSGEFDGMNGEEVSGEIFGVLFALKQLADQVGMTRVLGKSEEGRLALFLVLARIAHGGSRRSAVRWAEQHAVSDILGLEEFDENDLYRALDWLEAEQKRIERQLYEPYVKRSGKPPAIVLYDVTSSYFEGEQNELADYGYNRDGKKGKKPMVIGLLTGADGEPLAVRVFEGNTADPTTVGSQIELLKQRFGVSEVVFIGDRGMIKTQSQDALGAQGWRYISAITKPQIRAVDKGVVVNQNKSQSARGRWWAGCLPSAFRRRGPEGGLPPGGQGGSPISPWPAYRGLHGAHLRDGQGHLSEARHRPLLRGHGAASWLGVDGDKGLLFPS